MALKEIKVQYLDKEETITVETKPKAGVILPIVKRAQKVKTGPRGEQQVEIDEDEWFIGLATNIIEKAPWAVKSVDAIRNMDIDSYNSVKIALSEDFPLWRFLYPGQRMVYGSLFDETALKAQMESTSSSPSGESPNFK